MITKYISKVFLYTAVLLISACAGPQIAKDVATQMRKITLDYDTAITTKVQAEQDFYQKQQKILRETLNGTAAITNPNEEKPDDAKNTIAYGQIRTSIERDAILLANTLSSSPTFPKISTDLIMFLDNGLKEDQNAYLLASQRHQQLKIDLLNGLESIDQQSNRLKSILDELQKLENDPSMEDKLNQYFVIGQAVRAQIATQNE